MGRIILFSPVGGTDPVSNTNFYDGALIHIARVYKPDKIYLYMSNLTMEWEAEDGRYAYCLERLYENMDKDLDYEKIERPELTEVQDFDYFYDDYKAEITTIMSTMNKDDTLLINTSSGTPGMKSALVVLATIGDIDGSLVQVTTPEKTINQHDHKKYDVKALWELDPDNEPDFENRCKIIECPSLYQVKNEEIIKSLIRSYDYQAAFGVARTLPDRYTSSYIHLLEYAYHRVSLNRQRMFDLERNYSIPAFLPSRDERKRDLFEYALSLFLKPKMGLYADFIRGITPLIVELFVLLVKEITGVYPYDYCICESNGGYKWDLDKMKGTKVDNWVLVLSGSNGYVNSQSMYNLISSFAKDKDDITLFAGEIREIESSIRNIAAHQITTVTDETIYKATENRVTKKKGKTSKEIIELFKKMFGYCFPDLPSNIWQSYDDMNDCIVAQINSVPRLFSHDS